MIKTDFIRIVSIGSDNTESIFYVNQNQIVRVYELDNNIIIETSNYEILTICGYSLDTFMERFIKS
jgi:hypothetical protein